MTDARACARVIIITDHHHHHHHHHYCKCKPNHTVLRNACIGCDTILMMMTTRAQNTNIVWVLRAQICKNTAIVLHSEYKMRIYANIVFVFVECSFVNIKMMFCIFIFFVCPVNTFAIFCALFCLPKKYHFNIYHFCTEWINKKRLLKIHF